MVNTSRRPQGADVDGRTLPPTNSILVSNPARLVGDYTNPILKPQAAEVVKKHGEMELSGAGSPTPTIQCWPEPVPYIFNGVAMQMLQQPDKITFLYPNDHQARRVRMNQPHPAQVTPSWYGDSVGRYEGDTLVIDTVGVKIGPFPMVDFYGTPYTQALHVVERYRLLDFEVGKEGLERDAKENRRPPLGADAGAAPDYTYRGKLLQLQFTVEDEGVFTMPWTATITYRRARRSMAGGCLRREHAGTGHCGKGWRGAAGGQAGFLSGGGHDHPAASSRCEVFSPIHMHGARQQGKLVSPARSSHRRAADGRVWWMNLLPADRERAIAAWLQSRAL